MDDKLTEALELLKNSKSKKRESGAKRLRKIESKEAGPFLLAALEKEVQASRTWSPQYQMIFALGFSKYQEALPFLNELASKNFDATILYCGLGDAIFRLSILNNSVEVSLEHIYSFNNFRITYGAFQALAMLQIIPEDKAIKKIIEIALDPKGVEVVQGYPGDQSGLKKWVASASAGWKDELKLEFLDSCSEINDDHVKMAVESARKGKYINWKPY